MRGRAFLGLTVFAVFFYSYAQAQFLDIERGNRAFNRGEYDDAKRHYEKVLSEKATLEEKKEALFNSASADYKKREYEAAIKQFESLAQNPALSTELRADAHYNIGNALVKRGKDAPVEERMKFYQQALNAYKQAMALNPRDRDAKENYEFTRSLLQREKERQQQREQNRQDRNPQDDNPKDPKRPDQQQSQNQNQQQQESEQGEKKNEEPPKDSPNPNQPPEEKSQPKPQNFTPEEAEQILNALKKNEKEMLRKYQMKKSNASAKPEKDW
jgi:tetratricopeptide (TPR) repeat protein